MAAAVGCKAAGVRLSAAWLGTPDMYDYGHAALLAATDIGGGSLELLSDHTSLLSLLAPSPAQQTI